MDYQIVAPFKDDGGAYCQAYVHRKQADSVQLCFYFCYLDFCKCCQGCQKKYRETQQIYCRIKKEVGPDQFEYKTLFESPELTEKQIFNQQVLIYKETDGHIAISLRHKIDKSIIVLSITEEVFPDNLKNIKFKITDDDILSVIDSKGKLYKFQYEQIKQ